MAKTKYVVDLSEEERITLTNIVNDDGATEKAKLRAKVLLLSDINNEEKLSIPKIAERLGSTHTTVQAARMQYATSGVKVAVTRKKKEVPYRTPKYGDDVQQLIAQLLQEEPPAGKKQWSVRTMTSELMERGLVDTIGMTTVAKIMRSINK